MSSGKGGGAATVAVLGGLDWLRMEGVPLWAILLLGLAGLTVVLVSVVFPQESAHRLAWWRSWWRTRNRRR